MTQALALGFISFTSDGDNVFFVFRVFLALDNSSVLSLLEAASTFKNNPAPKHTHHGPSYWAVKLRNSQKITCSRNEFTAGFL